MPANTLDDGMAEDVFSRKGGDTGPLGSPPCAQPARGGTYLFKSVLVDVWPINATYCELTPREYMLVGLIGSSCAPIWPG